MHVMAGHLSLVNPSHNSHLLSDSFDATDTKSPTQGWLPFHFIQGAITVHKCSTIIYKCDFETNLYMYVNRLL